MSPSLSFRVPAKAKVQLELIAKAEGRTLSGAARRIILGYLNSSSGFATLAYASSKIHYDEMQKKKLAEGSS